MKVKYILEVQDQNGEIVFYFTQENTPFMNFTVGDSLLGDYFDLECDHIITKVLHGVCEVKDADAIVNKVILKTISTEERED